LRKYLAGNSTEALKERLTMKKGKSAMQIAPFQDPELQGEELF
jgi:hypothetical protein